MPARTLAGPALAAGSVLVLDQGAKTLVRDALALCAAPPVRACDRIALAGPVGILRTENDGSAFGITGAAALPLLLVATLALVVLLVRLAGLRTPSVLAAALLTGGSAANLVDRLARGTVTDFLDLRWGLADRGLVANPADLAIAGGGIALALLALRALDRRAPVVPATVRGG